MDFSTTLAQIGRMNVLAVSGGRVERVGNTLRLPVARGYAVEVDLDRGSDTYNVRRTFTRSGVRKVKGEQTRVYCDELGESVYQASLYLMGPFGDAA